MDSSEKTKRKTPDEFFKSLENYEDFIYNVYKTNTGTHSDLFG